MSALFACRLGFSDARGHLKASFPNGIPLASAFVSPSLLLAVEGAVEDAICCGTLVNIGPLLPPTLSTPDVATLLAKVPGLTQDKDVFRSILSAVAAIATGAGSDRGVGAVAGAAAGAGTAAGAGGTKVSALLVDGTWVISATLVQVRCTQSMCWS